VAAGETDVVQVVEPDAELRAAQGVFGCLQFACHTVGLEALDPCGCEVHIRPPPGDSGVLLNGAHFDAGGLHGLCEVLPGVSLGVVEVGGLHVHVAFASASVDEGLLANAVGVPADGCLLKGVSATLVHPEVAVALGAELAFEFEVPEQHGGLEFVRVGPKLRPC